jgi:predicted signal transduction protein with EAL and GGDEF domain
MRHADLAMYSAKEAGRNGIQFYDESMDARARSRLALEYEIRRGLENGEFEAFYQPRVDCFSGRIVRSAGTLATSGARPVVSRQFHSGQ